MLGGERWAYWLVFDCANRANHPADAQVGVAVLTNSFYGPLVMQRVAERVCSVCGQPFVYVGQETALTLYLAHDFERMKNAGYNVMKDEEVLGTG